MDVNQEKDFMIILKNRITLILSILLLISCNDTVQRDIIPYTYVDIEINVNNQQYLDLRQEGGYVNIEGAVKGMIVYHKNGNNYSVYERNCPYQPSADCAQVKVDDSLLFIQCPCCSSQFDFNGQVLSGPSVLPLKQYATTLTGSYLRITN